MGSALECESARAVGDRGVCLCTRLPATSSRWEAEYLGDFQNLGVFCSSFFLFRYKAAVAALRPTISPVRLAGDLTWIHKRDWKKFGAICFIPPPPPGLSPAKKPGTPCRNVCSPGGLACNFHLATLSTRTKAYFIRQRVK